MNHRGEKYLIPWPLFWMIGGAIPPAAEIITNALLLRFPVVLHCFPASPFRGILVNSLLYVLLWISGALLFGTMVEIVRRLAKTDRRIHILAPLGLICALIAYLGHGIVASDMSQAIPTTGIPDNYRPLWLWLWAGIGVLIFLGAGVRLLSAGRPQSLRSAAIRLFPLLAGLVIFNVFDRSTGSWLIRLSILGAVTPAATVIGFGLNRHLKLAHRLLFLFPLLSLPAIITLAGYFGWPGKGYDAHLILMVWDAQRPDTMSIYNQEYTTTPRLARRRDQAVIFNRAYCPANYSFASHVSIFTGLYQREHHLYDGTERDRLAYESWPNLGDLAAGRKYRPLMMTESPWLMVLRKGFAEVVNCPIHQAVENIFLPFYRHPFLGIGLIDHLTFIWEGDFKYSVLRIEDRVLYQWLLRARREGPYFLFVNWMYAHSRYYPGYDQKADEFAQAYHRGTEFMDRRLEEWIDCLTAAGQFSRSLFLLTADHGEFLGEWGMYGHSKTLLEPALHVPLILFGEPVPPGIIEEPVPLVALKSALEKLLPATPGQPWDVRGFIEAMLENRGVVAEGSFDFEEPDNAIRWFLACWDGRMKYMQDRHKYIPDHSAGLDTESFYFLYDLAEDPGEERNLIAERPEAVARMRELIDRWEATLDPAPLPPPEEEEEKEYPPGLAEQMRALGYDI